jgi:hypothetical protein
LAILLIGAGSLLLIYQDPQFALIFKSSTSNSPSTTSPSGSSFFAFSGSSGASSSSSGITVAYSALDIIESLIGAGLVGFGLVLVGVGMLTGSVRTGVEQDVK